MAPRRPSAPSDSVAGRRLKSLPPASNIRVPATQAEARPASRKVLLGKAPNPCHHALANARSSSSASAARKGPLHPHKVPFGPAHWGPQPVPQTPRTRHLGCLVRSPAPAAGWPQPQSRGSSSQRRPSRLAARKVLSVPLLLPSHTTSTSVARFTISALRTWVAAVGPWVA